MFLKSISRGKTSVVLLLAGEGGEETVVLSPGEWKRLSAGGPSLSESDEITPELYDRLKEAAGRTAALRDCAAFLKTRDRSETELRRKLKEKRHSPESIDAAVQYVRSRGYLNEENACLRYAESAVRTNRYGPRRIAAYLRSHGYDAAAASKAAASVPAEDYRSALLYQIKHRFSRLSADDPAERKKAVAALLRLGFTADEIRSALRESR